MKKMHILLALCALAVLVFAFDASAATLVTHLFNHPGGLLAAAAPIATATLPDAIKAELDRISGELKEHAERAFADAKGLSEKAKEQVDDLLIKTGEISGRLATSEQLLATLQDGGTRAVAESYGEQFVHSDEFKAFASKATPRGRVDLTFNAAITTLTTDADGSAGDLIGTTRVPGVQMLPERRMTVRDLLTPGRTDTGLIEYVQETGFTNAAAPVAEGAAKPESTIKFDLLTANAKVIAHYMKASRQVLSDAPQLASIIDGKLRYGLAYVEENELLNGDGTGQHLLGIIPQATAFAAPFDPAGTETGIDNIRLAMLQAALAEYPATGIVMHPSDWARIELLKDTTGRYLIGNPQGTLSPTLWGLPVVATQAVAVDKYLVGAFKLGAQIFDRWQARVEVATENEDDFIKNLVTVLAEERLALAVYRPEAFIYGDFGNVA
jgi:HK97 family phage major capsid protein